MLGHASTAPRLALLALLGGCVEQAPAAIERGSVIAAAPAFQDGENTGGGAAAGMVLGAVAGGLIGGRGIGQAVGVAVGAAIGGTTGSAAEAAGQPRNGMAYTIRLLDGRVMTIVQHVPPGAPVFATGNGVVVETRGRAQRVVPE